MQHLSIRGLVCAGHSDHRPMYVQPRGVCHINDVAHLCIALHRYKGNALVLQVLDVDHIRQLRKQLLQLKVPAAWGKVPDKDCCFLVPACQG